ncbi:MAG TPA: response regulator [Spirochaetota bacterium]|nr:response regulator [Spirochaetota bacterium]HPY86891.1 response regulator [Spirochaetota bacterium]
MQKTILIVDDDPGFVADMLNGIIDKNYSISVADSLNRAINMIQCDAYDYIIANVKIPGGNSIVLKDKLRGDTKLLFMSNLESDSEFIKKSGDKFYYKLDMPNLMDLALENA